MLRIPALVIATALMPAIARTQSPQVQALYSKAHQDGEAGRQDAAIADYRALLQLDPTIAPAYNNLGRLLYNADRFAEAAEELQKGLAIDGSMAPAQVLLGASYLQLGRVQDALTPLLAGVQALPADQFALMTLTRVYLRLDRPADAVPFLEKILAANANDQEAWYLLGKAHLQLSQQAFQQVQHIDANSPLAHEMAGEIMESMQNTPGAVAAYKAALAASPSNVSALDHLGNLYWSTGDWSHAREYLKLQTAKQPNNCLAHWKLANVMDELAESPEEVLPEINHALELCPSLPQAHAERARVLLKMSRPGDALTDLALAEKAAPEEASLQQLYARAYLALGDKPRAAEANRRFQQMEAAQRAEQEQKASRVVHANQ